MVRKTGKLAWRQGTCAVLLLFLPVAAQGDAQSPDESEEPGLWGALQGSSATRQVRLGSAVSLLRLSPEMLAGPTRRVSPEQVAGASEKAAADAQRGSLEPLVEAIWNVMYDAGRHKYASIWSEEHLGTVSVRRIPGTLVWFNPEISIPELGIEAGKPLTDEQKKALVTLFSVKDDACHPDARLRGAERFYLLPPFEPCRNFRENRIGISDLLAATRRYSTNGWPRIC